MNGPFKERILMYDFARGRRFKRKVFIELLSLMSDLKFNALMIYLEGAFAFDFLPGIIRGDVITPDDARWLKREAQKNGISLIPATNICYHVEHFIDQERNEMLRDRRIEGRVKQVDLSKKETIKFMRKVVTELAKHFRTDIVHIGGDEAWIDPANQDTWFKSYKEYFSSFCYEMLQSNLIPGLWADVFLRKPELLDEFPKGIRLYDWHYYGHRVSSLNLLRKRGFDIVACVSDNSWETSFNFQKDLNDPGVHPAKVEAFLEDAVNQNVDKGCITIWEMRYGNSFWTNLYPIARAALFMSGELPLDEESTDKKIDSLLFLNKSPLCELTRLIHKLGVKPIFQLATPHGEKILRTCPFSNSTLSFMIIDGVDVFVRRILNSFEKLLKESKLLMRGWDENDERQRACKKGFTMCLLQFRFALELLKTVKLSHRFYHKASLCQYSNRNMFQEYLYKSSTLWERPIGLMLGWKQILRKIGQSEGQPISDLEMLTARITDLKQFKKAINNLAFSKTVLPNWRGFVSKTFPDSYLSIH